MSPCTRIQSSLFIQQYLAFGEGYILGKSRDSSYARINPLLAKRVYGDKRHAKRSSKLCLKCDYTRAETRFRLSAKRTSHLNRQGRQFSRLLASEVCASAVVMLDTACSEVVWRVLATQSIHQFPLHFPSRVSPCAITFQLDSNSFNGWETVKTPLLAFSNGVGFSGCKLSAWRTSNA